MTGGAFSNGRIVSCTRPVHGRKRGLRWPELGPASRGGYFLGAFAGVGIGAAGGLGLAGLLLALPLMALGLVLGDLADQKAGVQDKVHSGTAIGQLADGRETQVELFWRS